MTPDKIMDFGNWVLDTAKEILETHGEVHPVVFISPHEGSIGIIDVSVFMKEGRKDLLGNILREMTKKTNIEMIAFISEVWMAKNIDTKEFDKFGSVEKMPSRIEAVMLSIETPDENWMCQAEIIERDGKKTFDIPKLERMTQVEGRLVGFFNQKKNELLN